jgi:ABC-type amino acid transport system permease subunit
LKWYYWVGFIVAVLLEVLTLIPAPASKPSLLGYYAHCSFTPISTIILWIVAGIIYWLGRRGGK